VGGVEDSSTGGIFLILFSYYGEGFFSNNVSFIFSCIKEWEGFLFACFFGERDFKTSALF
jgi:hypothetical protein